MSKDYLAQYRAEPTDLLHFGVKGMKWGVRKDSGSAGGKATKAVGKVKDRLGARDAAKKAAVEGMLTHPGTEASPERYARITAVAKAGRTSELTDDDLRFYNARSNAIRQVDQLNAKKPNWFAQTGVKVLQKTAEATVAGVASGVTSHYVTKPLVKAITELGKDKATQKVAKEVLKPQFPLGFSLPK